MATIDDRNIHLEQMVELLRSIVDNQSRLLRASDMMNNQALESRVDLYTTTRYVFFESACKSVTARIPKIILQLYPRSVPAISHKNSEQPHPLELGVDQLLFLEAYTQDMVLFQHEDPLEIDPSKLAVLRKMHLDSEALTHTKRDVYVYRLNYDSRTIDVLNAVGECPSVFVDALHNCESWMALKHTMLMMRHQYWFVCFRVDDDAQTIVVETPEEYIAHEW